MPLYEYECSKCGHRFEKIQKFSDPPVKKCPQCGGKVEQLISAPAVQFKGSGWYVTDYARKGGAPGGSGNDHPSSDAAKSASDEKGDKGAKAEVKSEAKNKPKSAKK